MTNSRLVHARWRVCVTRDEGADGALALALRAVDLEPVACPVFVAAPPLDPAPLIDAAVHLERYDWVVVASARSVRALLAARQRPWPAAVRAAAVGAATARALQEADADPPLVGDADGADPLWAALRHAGPWPGRRILVPTTPGGRQILAERLREAGAHVDEVEAYRMAPRSDEAIARDWSLAAPDAVTIASPRVAERLVAVLGRAALTRLHAVVTIGDTTAAALARLAVPCVVAGAADFARVAATVAACRTAEVR